MLDILTSFGATITVKDDDIFAIFGAFIGAIIIPLILFAILQIVAMWKIFTKCGVEGWKSIIPIYNYVVLLQIVGINPLWILTMLIPFVGTIFSIIIAIAATIRLSKGFGKSDGFTVGLILLSFIFEIVLAFDSSKWDASRINYNGFSFLNGNRPAGATANGKTATGNTTAKKDEWVDGK
jgi:hypothetical protein